MNTLTRVGNSTFRINSPAHCGALTRNGGKASHALCNRIDKALGGVHALAFKQGRNTKAWYVQAK